MQVELYPMLHEDAIPIAVPLEPGTCRSETIPADRHVLFWTRLRPVEQQAGKSIEVLRFVLNNVDGSIRINGSPVGTLTEVVGSDDQKELVFWNLSDPIDPGFHTVEFEFDFPQQISLPPCELYPDFVPLQWEENPTAKVEINTKDTGTGDLVERKDPIWGKRNVYEPVEC